MVSTITPDVPPLYTCPAYDVVEGPRERFGLDPVLVLNDGDEIACLNVPYPDLHKQFQVGSVVGYALRNGDCPVKALDRARANGHDLWFIFGLAVSITAHKQARKTYIGVTIGQRVRFEGRYFEIVKTGREHLGFKEIAEA